jgi:hypothetical protein
MSTGGIFGTLLLVPEKLVLGEEVEEEPEFEGAASHPLQLLKRETQ